MKYSLDSFVKPLNIQNKLVVPDFTNFKLNDFYYFCRATKRNASSYLSTKEFEGTPDLVSYQSSGAEDMWWILCMYNSQANPFTSFEADKEFVIPDKEDIDNYLNSKTKTNDNKVARLN